MQSLERVRDYFNREAVRFDAIYEAKKPLYQRLGDALFRGVVVERFHLICNLAPVPGAWSVLDVGCGSGRYALALAVAGAARVVGVDVAASMIELAREQATAAGVASRCAFEVSAFLDFTSTERFDVVVATGYMDRSPPRPRRHYMASRAELVHAFTVDVEDWYHGIPIAPADKTTAERRLAVGLDRLLELLANAGVRGTFFCLGPLAGDHPRLVNQIVRAGHELGCHGWSHDLLYNMTPDQMRAETQQAVEALCGLTGVRTVAYRAAYFSITRRSFWALEVLASLGFRYDSSIFPVRNWRYGIEDFAPSPQMIETAAGPILELPISVRRVLGRNVPISGGAYFRLYPYAVTRSNFKAAEAAGRPVVFYLHPWELDPDHPRVPFAWKPRATHYANLGTTLPKLTRLLREFRFAPLGEVLEHAVARASS